MSGEFNYSNLNIVSLHKKSETSDKPITLQWRNNERDGVSNQPFAQAQIKENIKAPHLWPLWWEFTGDRWIHPPHRTTNAENISTWWRHHEKNYDMFSPLISLHSVTRMSGDICQLRRVHQSSWSFNSLRPSDAYMRQYTNHHWFR